jgi:hypothetical protein
MVIFHSYVSYSEFLFFVYPSLDLVDEDVEALLNGGSLLDAPCISVATEQLVQAPGDLAFS